MTPHKHAEFIKAWADGAEIEESSEWSGWYEFDGLWDEDYRYRIKQTKNKTVKRWLWVYKFSDFDWELVNELLSDDEAAIRKANNPQNKYMKLSWSETEFEE